MVLAIVSCFYSLISFSQVTSEVDTTKIRIGEQINYKINVETDTTNLVVFPEGQTFMPLEAVEALKIDTTKKESKFVLSRIYKLTQFDSGAYTIPRQKIIIGEKPFYTDSLGVEVNTIKVDTTKQKLYDIKPIIEVDKSSSNWWKWLLLILAIIGIIGFLLYWFIWRKKPLTEEEEIALLPPYERAKISLKKLDESQYLIRSEVKEYYSELTQIIRSYLDEKVYERSLESTTDELIERLQLLKEGNQVPLTKDTIKNLESILKRADLVKFAKSLPETGLIVMDRATIEKELDNVKASLPEPSEEEKLLDQKYKEEQERKKKRNKVILTGAISLFLLIATYVGFGLKFGFGYVNDTLLRHESKVLLEGEWVTSKYGIPPFEISTPDVLRRLKKEEKGFNDSDYDKFLYVNEESHLSICLIIADNSDESIQLLDEKTLGLAQINAFEKELKAENIVVIDGEFETDNGFKGFQVKGTMNIPIQGSENNIGTSYKIVSFKNEKKIFVFYVLFETDDSYSVEIEEKIYNSIKIYTQGQEKEEEQK
ncbi:MAG: hypothetical protein Wins2KO_18860 [Winogradskyella sp.]